MATGTSTFTHHSLINDMYRKVLTSSNLHVAYTVINTETNFAKNMAFLVLYGLCKGRMVLW